MKRKIITAVISLAVAFALWNYVVSVVGPEYEDTFRDVAVSVDGESILEQRGLMLVSDKTPTITLRLSGNRSDLNKLNPSNIKVAVDLSKIYDPGVKTLTPSISFPGNVASGAITVQSRNPSFVTLEIVRRQTKEIPVEIQYIGEGLSEEYVKGKADLSLEKLHIAGPENEISNIAKAIIQVELSSDTKTEITGAFDYILSDASDNPVKVKHTKVTTEDAEQISLSLPIERVVELPLVLEIIEGGGATKEHVKITPETIMVSGREELLTDLTEISLGKLDLSTMTESVDLVYEITLPEGLTNRTIPTATVKVSFENLTTRTITVSNFKVINVPRGMKATVSAHELNVTIRGEKALVNALTAEEITVQVNCADLEAGKHLVDAQIVVANANGKVGAVGPYPVVITINEN
ncbi:MAG: hypothetical protein J6C41_00640 [Oscillospiraceae bacterium]|nr:hypothetical protein [Oscillospiraceae bacterium]